MAATNHWLLTQIVVDSTNDTVRFKAQYGMGSLTTYTCQITHGTYTTIFDLVANLQTAMETADTGGSATYTWSMDGTTGKLTVTASGLTAFALVCTYTTNHAWTLLGCATGSDKSGYPTITGNYQIPHAWVMPRGPARDTYDRPRILGAETVVALSGAAERVTWSDQTVREVEWKVVPASRYLTRFASTNEAFEKVWEDMTHGYYVSYYTHSGSSYTLEGKYALVCEGDERLEGDRLSPGAAYYNTPTLKLVKQS